MTRKRAKSADQTSFETMGTTGALPPVASGETPPSAIVYAVPGFTWEMSDKKFAR